MAKVCVCDQIRYVNEMLVFTAGLAFISTKHKNRFRHLLGHKFSGVAKFEIFRWFSPTVAMLI